MNNIPTIVILSAVLVCGCSSEAEQGQTTSSLYDLNEDGINDITYEDTEDGYYEFVDRNFDGKVDESHHYSKSDKLLSSKIDDDFDGYLETEVFYSKESIHLSSVDSDSDQLRDIFYFYQSGTLVKGIKYYPKKKMIGSIEFDFGYPSKESISGTEASPKQFHDMHSTSVIPRINQRRQK